MFILQFYMISFYTKPWKWHSNSFSVPLKAQNTSIDVVDLALIEYNHDFDQLIEFPYWLLNPINLIPLFDSNYT